MQWVPVSNRPGTMRWKYGNYRVLLSSNDYLVELLTFSDNIYVKRLGDFKTLEDAKHFVEMHYAVGAGN